MDYIVNRGGVVVGSPNKGVAPIPTAFATDITDLDDDGVLIAKTIPAIADNIDNDGIFTIDRGDEILYNLDLGEHPIAAGTAPSSEVPSSISGGWTADNTKITADDSKHTADET